MKTKLTFWILLLIICSCNNQPSNTKDIWANTQKIRLEEESATLRIPNGLKRIGIEDIRNLTYVTTDSARVNDFIEGLQAFQFEDNVIDVFADDDSKYGIISITDGKLMPIDAYTGAYLSTTLRKTYDQLEIRNFDFTIKKIDSKMKQTDKIKMVKLKHKFTFKEELGDTVEYQTFFFITTPYRSLIVYEWSANTNDIEDYLWSVDG